jgi:heptosyltransferase-3
MTIAKRLERLGKYLIASTLAGLQRSEIRPSEQLDLSRVRRVLFVRVNFRMGNLLLATPGFATARDSLPDAEIDVLTTSTYSVLLAGNSDLDHILTLDRWMLVRPWVFFGLVRRMRSRQYDLVIDCSGGKSISGALLAGLSRGRWRVVPASGRYKAGFNVLAAPKPGCTHKVDALLALLESIGMPAGSPDLRVFLAPHESRWAEQRWREWGLSTDQITVGVNIGARGDKRWPMDDFLDLVRWLDEEMRVQAIMFVGPQDRARLHEVGRRLPPNVIVDTTSDVRRFAALLACCAIVITADTGPMHLAAAVGTPTVSIFLKRSSEFFAPRGSIHRVVHLENGGDAAAVRDVLSDVCARVSPRYRLKQGVTRDRR